MTVSLKILPRSWIFLLIFAGFSLVAKGEKARKFPQRIVSCAVVGDEILLQILPSPQEKKRVIAVSTLADNPLFSSVSLEARAISQRVGANVEQVLHLKPDLVIVASFNQPDFVAQIRNLKLNVHVLEGFQSLADLRRHILNLGELTGAESAAQELLARLQARILDLKKGMPPAQTLLVMMADRT